LEPVDFIIAEFSMKKFLYSLLFIFIGIIIGFVLVFVFVIGIAMSFSSGKTVIKSDSYLVLDFNGLLKEKPQPEFPGLMNITKKSMSLIDFIKSIQNASIDDRIKGILINGDMAYYDRSHVEEINSALKKFKDTGKKIYAWFSNCDNNGYMICIQADQIYMPETNSASLTLKGYSITTPYVKKGLDTLGISFDIIHIGNYKGTGENLNRDRISNESYEKYTGIYDSILQKDIDDISKSRKVEKSAIYSLMSAGKTVMMTPSDSKKYGFIDNFSTLSELKEKYRNFVSIEDYSTQLTKHVTENKIAVLYAEGTIYDYAGESDSFGNDTIGAGNFIKQISEISNDNSIKAVVIRVNSPGGSALASELIYRELIKLKNKKPVYISMGPVAASGGYYISSAGSKIFATETTLTGSIGVVSILMNYKELADKLGINFETVKKFKYDDIFSSYRAPTDDEIALMRAANQRVYDEFTNHIIEGRKIKSGDMPQIAEGRLWTGSQAVKNKLVDFIGGIDDTIEYASRTNNINDYSIVSYPKPRGILSQLTDISQTKIEKTIINDSINSTEEIRQLTALFYYGSGNKNKPSVILPFYDLP
jgi:protease IV